MGILSEEPGKQKVAYCLWGTANRTGRGAGVQRGKERAKLGDVGEVGKAHLVT